jgi:hypothetical protein
MGTYFSHDVSSGGGGGGGTSSNFGAAFPAAGTAAGAKNPGGNLAPVLVDASGFLEVNVEAIGTVTVQQPTGSNLHVDVDNFPATQPVSGTVATNADTTIGGTSAPGKELLVAGKTNDATAQYQPLPEGAGGRSVIVEGFAGGTAVPVSLAANQSVNVAQVAGAATGATNPLYVAVADGTNGPAAVKAASTQAAAADKSLVVQINPNQPNLTTPLNVALAANQSVNVAQVGGNATAVDAGIANTGTPRVVQATANVLNITQVTVPTTAGGIALIAANANRIKVRVTNTGTNPIYIFTTSSPTVLNGDFVPGIAGYPWISRYEGALWAIASGGSQIVTVYEESSQ